MIYLDSNSTTKTDSRVIEAMLPFFSEWYFNSSSSHHFGQMVNNHVDVSREKIVNLISGDPSGLIFTSGATEAINLGLKGLALHPTNEKNHIITVSSEHKAVLDTVQFLESLGFRISYLPVDSKGMLNLDQLKNCMTKDTLCVVIMYVNNETGVIHDIENISNIIHEHDSLFFCDTTQAFGKIPINLQNTQIDFLTISAHKFYGPKGIGALYINRKNVNLNCIQPMITGGGQEGGIRSGTLNVPGIVGLGVACEIASIEMDDNKHAIANLRNKLERRLLQLPGAFVNGDQINRIFNTTNICFPDIDANTFIQKSRDFVVSNGSACSSGLDTPSHVLMAMGLSYSEASNSIRFSLGKELLDVDFELVIDSLFTDLLKEYA